MQALKLIDDLLVYLEQDKMAQAPQRQVLICGGGNGAHVFACLAASNPNNKVHWISFYADEAERINKQLTANGNLKIDFSAEKRELLSKPALVTKDAAAAIPGTDLAIICVPSFAHKQYLDAIATHGDKDMTVATYPSGCGFELQFIASFNAKESKTKSEQHVLVNCFTLPWSCRIKEYGKEVEVLGSKHVIEMAVGAKSEARIKSSMEALQGILGKQPIMEYDPKMHVLGSTMGSINPIVHPPIMYGQWKDWDGKPMKERPLFYQGISDFSAQKMIDMTDDIIKACAGLNKSVKDGTEVAVQKIFPWYVKTYGKDCDDTSSLKMTIRTNPGYRGLVHPCKQQADGLWVPDYGYRYLTEDIPFGLICVKGYALLAGVETPTLDEVLRWAEKALKKDYLGKDGKLTGKDLKETRSPQAFGLKLEEILATFDRSKK